MKYIVKDMDIATGGVIVALLNQKDARKFDLHHEDRILVKHNRKQVVAIVDIGESSKAVPQGHIGCFEELLNELHIKHKDKVEVLLEKKPESLKYIKKKLDGKRLSESEIFEIITDVVNNKLTATELTYFIAASYTKGLSLDETVYLTRAMIETGDVLKFNKRPIVDKHCIGGVAGNRVTMAIVPMLVAAGLTVPKTSSRSITSPAGTADTMEVLANVSLTKHKIKSVVDRIGGCVVWGGAVNLAPADDKIIKVENPLSIDAEGNLLSSILAKKGSVSATHVLIDIPVGIGAKVEDLKVAHRLKREFEKLGKGLGMKIKCIITDGSEPIGNGIGPALEARDVLWLLMNDIRAPSDLRKKAIYIAEEMLELAGKSRHLAKDVLFSGKAYDTFVKIIKAQGAKIINPDKIKLGKFTYKYFADRNGRILHIDNKEISKIARLAGAPQDKGAGIYLCKHKNSRVVKGEKIFTIYAENEEKLNFAVDTLATSKAVTIL